MRNFQAPRTPVPRPGACFSLVASALRAAAFVTASSLALTATTAHAAGFDTPIMYTARHQAMGGTAVGYVDDPSAAYHNPAGLQGVHGLALLGNLSMLLVNVTGSPAAPASASGIQSDLVIAPLFMVAGAYRAASWLSAGIAVFPVASGGAEYEYPVPNGGSQYQYNATSIVFYEATPLISLNVPKDAVIPGELSVGVGYRASFVSFERQQGLRADPQTLDLDTSGTNFGGVRLGLQYRPGPAFSIGAVYRNRVEVKTEGDSATVLGNPATDVTFPLVLPAQVGGGVRTDIDRLGIAFDAIYTFQSQNERSILAGNVGGNLVQVPNIFDWQDAFTLRFGFEYRLGHSEQLPIRVGYVYDAQVSSRKYPSAFGTPPVATQSFTFGGGYDAGTWELNLALALRGGSTTIDASELAPPTECPTCGFSGEYAISATGLYLDFSTDIQL